MLSDCSLQVSLNLFPRRSSYGFLVCFGFWYLSLPSPGFRMNIVNLDSMCLSRSVYLQNTSGTLVLQYWSHISYPTGYVERVLCWLGFVFYLAFEESYVAI